MLEITNWLSDYDSMNFFQTNKDYHKSLSKYKFKNYYDLDNIKNSKYFHNIYKITCHFSDNISQYIWLTHVLIGKYDKIYANDLKNISKSICLQSLHVSISREFVLPSNVIFLSYNISLNINLNNIKYLILPNYFNDNLIIPNNVTHLRLGNYFNQDIECQNLEYLWLGDAFNKKLINANKLKFLRLGTGSNIEDLFRIEKLICNNNYMLPESKYLKSLILYSNQISNYSIYPNLKSLKLKYHYDNIILPNSIIKLELNQCQCSILNITELINLKYMKVHNISTSKVWDIYPQNLLKLELSMVTGHITNLPISLTSLSVLSPITINAINPCQLKKLQIFGRIDLEKLREGILFVSQ